MDPIKVALPWLIHFELVDGRHRVVEEESVQKVVVDRKKLARMIESAAQEIQELRDTNRDKKTNVPQDVKDLIDLCRAYRLESLEHRYRCLRLVEYILKLHCVHGAHGSPQTLPLVPPEILWYLDTRALEC